MNADPIAGLGLRHVFLRDLELLASIGVHPHEHRARQRVRVNIHLGVPDDGEAERAEGREDLGRVVDYEQVAGTVRAIVAAGHVRLAETLAERLARACLGCDTRIQLVRVRIEKLDIFPDAAAAGVEIERRRPAIHPPSSTAGIDSQ